MKNIESMTYLKSISVLVKGAFAAQFVTLLCSPVITRLFTPDELGVYALVTGAVGMFGFAMSCRFEVCIVSENDEVKVNSLVKLSLLICMLLSCLLFVCYYIYFKYSRISCNPFQLSLVVFGLLFMTGIINVFTAYNNRNKDYRLITKSYVLRVLSQNICNVMAGLSHLGAIGLSVSHLIGYFVGVRDQAALLLIKRAAIYQISIRQMLLVFCENKKQALLSTPAVLANGFSYSIILYFVESLFSVAAVGYYLISYRILGLPLSIISANISRVFLEKASSEFKKKGEFQRTYLMTVVIQIILSIPIGFCLFLFAPSVCKILFGEGWDIAGNYIRILTPMFMFRFIAGGVNTSAIIVKKQQVDFAIQLILMLFTIIVFIIARFYNLEIEMFLIFLSIGGCIIYIIYLILFWLCSKNNNVLNF